jgi:hypothetical protein
MVAQGGGIGRALTGWIRSAGKSSVHEIAILSHFPRHGSQFVGWNSPCLLIEPSWISRPPGRQWSELSEGVLCSAGDASVHQNSAKADYSVHPSSMTDSALTPYCNTDVELNGALAQITISIAPRPRLKTGPSDTRRLSVFYQR